MPFCASCGVHCWEDECQHCGALWEITSVYYDITVCVRERRAPPKESKDADVR